MSETEQFAYEVAVVGLSGRFPGARNVAEFWDRLCEGAELITFFPDGDPNYVKAEGVLDGVELFDASFFGFTPREAATLDPQHRIFLEESWTALETAGYNSETYHGRIGVFAGESLNTYFLNNLYPNRKLLESLGASQVVIANDRDYLATQVSFRLNLKGPSFSIQTACSTSLVAVHLACQSLLNRECDMALAGGVSVSVPQGTGGEYQEGGIISPDGHCRAFDAKARGTVKGSGAGVVVLKRLADALHDRDTIHAVIKGSAINNDGAMKVGFTAPAVEGQANVIEEALALASIEPETIGYIETHGTGTVLGDPVEIAALTQAFRASSDATGFCPIGSVKTNIGHLDAAAGVASLIKTILALEHRQIPPSLNFEEPNPNIDFARSPFFVNTELRGWETEGTPRRAGVSSFGIGGTNAHLVLEEAPVVSERFEPSRLSSPQLLVLSARTQTALDQASTNLATHLEGHPQLDLADVAFTLSAGRKHFEHRRVVVCHDVADAVTALSEPDRSRVSTGASKYEKRPVAFMFPGQGAQYAGMGRALYEREPVFRSELDHCAELLRDSLGTDLREIIFESIEVASRVTDTRFAQPALFAIEYALAKLWIEWGLEPQAMIGHSIGEYVAACLAGVFSLVDALRLVAARGEIVQRLPRGAMLAVSLAPHEAERYLSEAVSIAAINSPSLCVLSGRTEAIEELELRLAGEGVICRRLHTSHAFHSQMMEPALEEFTALVRSIDRHAPRIPYLSNVTGRWITEAEVMDPSYWARHLREPVQFSSGVAELLKDTAIVLLEVGPGQSLGTLATQQPNNAPDRVALASLRPPKGEQSEIEFLLKMVGRLWLAGVGIDWARFYAGQAQWRVQLPSYPFERQRYWIDPPSTGTEILNEQVTETEPVTQTEHQPTSVAEVEAAMIDIWRELFGIANIRPHDNFFDHGGNSLIALQLVAQLRATFKIELPLRFVFESQTATALSTRIFEMITQEQEMAELDSLLREIESLAPEELQREAITTAPPQSESNIDRDARSINFGLYFFSDDGSNTSDDKYRLVLESAKFADQHGFTAIWTPERHFQDFGGLYPNPSVLSAALAVLTKRIQIRAGSVALPLHHPVRVAEEWSLVDNLSHGRAGVSFASGWHTNDFIFAPDVYDDRKEVMFRHIELIQKLWAGEKVKLPSAGGSEVEFRMLPRPVQQTLPIWITSSGSAETWRRAGEIGANVLAAYIGYSQEELAQRIELYREARAAHDHDPQTGIVTIMLHTFVGHDDETVKEKVRAPFSNYLRSYFKQYETTAAGVTGVSEADKDALMSAAFEKYFEESTLMGSPGKCARLVEELQDMGVDEIACLIDFGMEVESVLDSLVPLEELKNTFPAKAQRRKALPRF